MGSACCKEPTPHPASEYTESVANFRTFDCEAHLPKSAEDYIHGQFGTLSAADRASFETIPDALDSWMMHKGAPERESFQTERTLVFNGQLSNRDSFGTI